MSFVKFTKDSSGLLETSLMRIPSLFTLSLSQPNHFLNFTIMMTLMKNFMRPDNLPAYSHTLEMMKNLLQEPYPFKIQRNTRCQTSPISLAEWRMSHKWWKVQVVNRKVSLLVQEKTRKRSPEIPTKGKRLILQRTFCPHFEAHS